MRSWSISIGRLMGVEIRLHLFFVLLLGFSLLYTQITGISTTRGVALWLLLLGAVAVREIARTITAAYYGLQLRNILLLPIGGLFAHTTPESAEQAATGSAQMALAVVGPITNFLTAMVLLGLILAVSPSVSMLGKPLVTPSHLLRSAFWLNIFLAAVNLLPAYPLDAGRVLRGGFTRSRSALQATRAASSVGQVISLALFLIGIFIQNPWLILAGFFIFIAAQLEDQGLLFQSVVDTVHMRDVMLTEFSTLSASDTLEDALFKAVHSLQDDFPVVRGGLLVGIVTRQGILQALQSDGNGYIQGIMSRAFQVAQPGDSLGTAFRRISGDRGLSLVPVMDGERIVGIVTLQNLMHSMGLLGETRKLQQQSS
ncbi:MAG TPA: CBS domain-containing protein [Acidobacteriaceae bacterium]|jgi:Zn-dependent protease|nr:CBS domain-containing protein [Acidobacteriaceae bacterium]